MSWNKFDFRQHLAQTPQKPVSGCFMNHLEEMGSDVDRRGRQTVVGTLLYCFHSKLLSYLRVM